MPSLSLFALNGVLEFRVLLKTSFVMKNSDKAKDKFAKSMYHFFKVLSISLQLLIKSGLYTFTKKLLLL